MFIVGDAMTLPHWDKCQWTSMKAGQVLQGFWGPLRTAISKQLKLLLWSRWVVKLSERSHYYPNRKERQRQYTLNVRSQGKQLVLFSRESWCFPRRRENKTNWFPEGSDIKCFVIFLDFHFNSNKRITEANENEPKQSTRYLQILGVKILLTLFSLQVFFLWIPLRNQ